MRIVLFIILVLAACAEAQTNHPSIITTGNRSIITSVPVPEEYERPVEKVALGSVRVIDNPDSWGGYGVYIYTSIYDIATGGRHNDWSRRTTKPTAQEARVFAEALMDSVNRYRETGLTRGKIILMLTPKEQSNGK